MQRMLRVWRLLPPRYSTGADSKTVTDTPDSRAIRAAHSAALPPPTTATSVSMIRSTTPCNPISSAQTGAGGLHGTKTEYRAPEIHSKRHAGGAAAIGQPATGVAQQSSPTAIPKRRPSSGGAPLQVVRGA